MLTLSQVTSWTTKRPDKILPHAWGDYVYLNTNRMVDITEKNAGHVRFKYCQAPDDYRCSPDEITIHTTVDDLRLMHDGVATSKFAVLSIYPKMDTTETPVDTEVEWDDIAAVWMEDADVEADRAIMHCIYYQNAWKRIHCLIHSDYLTLLAAQGVLP